MDFRHESSLFISLHYYRQHTGEMSRLKLSKKNKKRKGHMTTAKTLEKGFGIITRKKACIFIGISQRLLQCCEWFAFSDGNEETI